MRDARHFSRVKKVPQVEQWSAFALETIAALNQAVAESGEAIEGNYCHFDGQPISGTVAPDPRRTAKRNVLRAAVAHCREALEIGFNAGHSAVIMLDSNRELQLTAVDIGTHRYGRTCADIIARRYPGRFRVHWGPSKSILRQLANNKKAEFDFIHIDGSHTVEDVTADMNFLLRRMKKASIAVLDDIRIPHISTLLRWSTRAGYLEEAGEQCTEETDNAALIRTCRPFRITRLIDVALSIGPPISRCKRWVRRLTGLNKRCHSGGPFSA
jgi:hypothetical protein